MKLRLRYIYGILSLLCVDVFFLIDISSENTISSEWIYIGILPVLFVGNILNKKFGYIVDKHKDLFTIIGLLVFSITVILMVYMIVNKK